MVLLLGRAISLAVALRCAAVEKVVVVVVEVEEAKIVPNFQIGFPVVLVLLSNCQIGFPVVLVLLCILVVLRAGARRSAVVCEGTPTLWYNVSPVQ